MLLSLPLTLLRRTLWLILLPIGVVRASVPAERSGPPSPCPPELQAALAAEQRGDFARALELLLEAERAGDTSAFVRLKIARQYSELVGRGSDPAAQARAAEQALAYSRAAVALAPRDPVARLSVAISRGKLALYGDNRAKVEGAREIKAEAEQALALDPNYDWAHHVLGRWHVETATLGRSKRFFAKLLYGGLPAANLDAGLTHLRRAVELAPRTVPHRIELGVALAASGREAEARREIETGLALPAVESHDTESQRRGRDLLAKLSPSATSTASAD